MSVPGAPLTPDPADQLSRAVEAFENGTEIEDEDEPEDNTPGEPPKPRDPENVRRELLRKQEKLEAKVMSKLDQMQASLQQSVSAFQGMLPGQQAAQSHDPNDVETWSLAQLKAGRDNILATNDPATLIAYNELLARKTVEDAIVNSMARERKTTQFQDTQADFTKKAIEKFGAAGLTNKNSAFYHEVQAEIERRKSWGPVPPSVTYDAAAFVADQQGYRPSDGTPRPTAALARGRTNAPLGNGLGDTSEIDSRIAKMEEAVGQKFSEESRKRIRENYSHLKANAHLYPGGK